MERLLYSDLLSWRSSSDRKPLIIEGVRQCGKTYLVEEFGKREFSSVAKINFEKNPSMKDLFSADLDPKRILRELGIILNIHISPGETLIFFDEIQACPQAITSLKYFCEEASDYCIIAAGSLLGVMLSRSESFPVGKVDRMRMYPMSFAEFVLANGEEALARFVMDYNGGILPQPIADRLEMYLREYFVVGGMPQVVQSWVSDHDITAVNRRQKSILEDYVDDFAKHANEGISDRRDRVDVTDLTQIWNSIPRHLARGNNKFMFGHVREGARSKDLEKAIQWLSDAGLIYKVHRAENVMVPLKANRDESDFKVYFVDIGLLRSLADYPPNFMRIDDERYRFFKGSFTENYVLCELMNVFGTEQHYWKDGRYEVDFLIQCNGDISPLEVKSERRTSSVSLKAYCEKNHPNRSYLTNMGSFRNGDGTFVPLYAVGSIRVL